MIIKKLIMMILVGSISFQVNSMKRSFEGGAIEESSKKVKTGGAPRQSLFSLFEVNDLKSFKAEAGWRKSYDKDSLNEKDSVGQTILFVVDGSKKTKSDEYFKILVDNGADINGGNDRTGMTILSSAAMDLDFKRMKRALELGADPNISPVDGVSPLLYLSAKQDIKFYPQQFEVLNILCAKTDVTKRAINGNTIMHSRFLQRPIAERLLLNGADIDVLNAQNKKPRDTCWVPGTCQLLTSREAVREQVVMPAIAQIVKQSQNFKDKDHFSHMPSNVSKLVFNRQIIGPRDLNSNRLTFVGK